MVVINNSVDILYDLFYKGEFVATVNYWQQIDVREQISRLGCEGYSLFINQKFRYLFDEEFNIENFEVTIDNGGGIDRPLYFLHCRCLKRNTLPVYSAGLIQRGLYLFSLLQIRKSLCHCK